MGTGAGASVFGEGNFAAGSAAGVSVAGSRNIAIGDHAGSGTAADPLFASDSVAIADAQVGSDASIAIGRNAFAASSVALGDSAQATGVSSIAIGDFSSASGFFSTTVGVGANTSGDFSTTVGGFGSARTPLRSPVLSASTSTSRPRRASASASTTAPSARGLEARSPGSKLRALFVNAEAFSLGRLSRIAAAFLLAAGSIAPALAQAPVPDAKRVEFMVKTAVVALNHANLTGNYTVLRDLGSPGFRANNTAARLAAVFAPLRERGLDLSPVVVFEPVLTRPVVSDELGRLRMTGYFPTRPLRILFDLAYEPIGNRWMISDMAVDVAPWPDEAAQNGDAQGQNGGDQGQPPAAPAPEQ
jgi:hypothetical protein